MKAYYHPEPLFGIETLRPEPIECEIVQLMDHDLVKIRYRVPENALIFILGGVPKEKRKAFDEERVVPAKDVYPIY